MSTVIVAPPRILVIRFGTMGAVLLTTPLIRALRKRHPHADIVALTARRYAPLLADNPHLTQVIGVGPERSLVKLAGELRRDPFTHHLDLQGDARSRLLWVLVRGSWRSFASDRIARTMLVRTKRNYYRDYLPMAERYFTAARDLDVQPDGGPAELFLAQAAHDQARTWLEHAGVATDRPFVALAPGASRATRRWPGDAFTALAKRVIETGAMVVLVGGPDESQLASEIAVRAGPKEAVSAAGALSLQGTGALLKRAAALIVGDTGLLHLATAVGTPVVALFGPTVRHFGYFPYHARGTVIERDLPCRPCSSRGPAECPLKHHLCLRATKPEDVFNALARTLGGSVD